MKKEYKEKIIAYLKELIEDNDFVEELSGILNSLRAKDKNKNIS